MKMYFICHWFRFPAASASILSMYEFPTPAAIVFLNLDHAEIVAKSPSIYSLAEIIILSIIITSMMIVIVVGNMLVIIAIATENNLTTVQNWFIASLAMADMMIGLVVMPFSLRSICCAITIDFQ